ncbi:hypothetical protein NS234_12230 [Microbacterium oxydans]|uniref:hypothetical protein n=1 Tax=Microbacterium oxydans TaxID=82380 RepID=UPI000734237D|nr:hypothetical protein [Microbacterium oxydans]KTR76188.1 hypothetical protein NS234_12230 [Microbacterium oxydans]
MTADSQGNDLDAVGVPITGMGAFAPVAIANVIDKAALGASPLVLPAAARRLGLYKVDGGPAPSRETGDAIEFFQKGYTLAGEGTRAVVINLAEQNAAVMALTEGAEPDENGVIEVSSSLPGNRFILYVVTRYRGGLEKRQVGVASVTAVEPDQQTRGEVEGIAVTFTWQEDELFNGAPFWQWGPAIPGSIPATGVNAGTPGSFTPAGAAAPATLAALQALGALGETTAWTTGQYIVLGNSSQAHWDGDSWAAGAAA